MKKNCLLLLVLPIVMFCAKIDYSNNETATNYTLGFEFAKSKKTISNSIKSVKKALNDFPESNLNYNSDSVYTECFKILNTMKENHINPDQKIFYNGFRDCFKNKKPAIEIEKMNQLRLSYFNTIASKNSISTEDFENKLKTDKEIIPTTSGLYYKILKQGKGNSPGPESRITVHMIGKLPNDYEFINTYDKGSPVQFYVKTIVKGMIEGLQLMKTGDRFLFFIPPQLGYGDKQNGIVPANSFMVFEIELIEVESGN